MIAIIITKAVPDHLRGYLGRFLAEVVPGVFAGKTTRVVADRLWARTTAGLNTGAMAMIVTDPDREQGYSFRTAGTDPPAVVDLDGLQLIATRYAGTMDNLDNPGASLNENSNGMEQSA